METANIFDLNLLRHASKIPSDILRNFPFWISSTELDIDSDYWPEGELPEGEELVGDERWVEFPENFSRQRLLFGEHGDEFEIWTPDWIELSQKHNGILFVIKGSDQIEVDWMEYPYWSVWVHLRFRSELDRMAAIRAIREFCEQQENPALFSEFLYLGRYPEAYFERDRTFPTSQQE
jgi:hypothetical protein